MNSWIVRGFPSGHVWGPPWNSPRSCPAGYNGTVNFCLQRQRPLTEPREMWSALWCGRIWVDEWPFFGLSGCRIALEMQKGVSNWVTMVEPCGIHNCFVEKQVESSGILHSMASNARCPDGHVGTWRDYDSRTYAAAVVKGQILSCDIHLEWTRQLDNWINLYKSGIYNWIWYTYGS